MGARSSRRAKSLMAHPARHPPATMARAPPRPDPISMPLKDELEGAGIEATRFLASYHDCLVDGLDTRDAESPLESPPGLARELETELEVMTFLEALVDLDFTGRSFGDFRLLKELGRGATGIVYEAYQVSLARHVAL